jgi:hypothetical protein
MRSDRPRTHRPGGIVIRLPAARRVDAPRLLGLVPLVTFRLRISLPVAPVCGPLALIARSRLAVLSGQQRERYASWRKRRRVSHVMKGTFTVTP